MVSRTRHTDSLPDRSRTRVEARKGGVAMSARSFNLGPPAREKGRGNRMRRAFAAVAAVALGLLLAAAARAETGDLSPDIKYTTRFLHPGPNGENDLTIENYIIQQINATPAGAQIAFAVRDWIRPQVATAVTDAHNRGVQVIGVI